MTAEYPRGSRASVALFLTAAFLLISMGGAIFAAPITLPLMFVAVRRRPSTRFRVAAAAIGGLTVAEAVWAAVYVTVSEAKPWIWLLPSVGGVLAAYLFMVVAPAEAVLEGARTGAA